MGSNTYTVRPGNYQLTIKKGGYKPQSKEISIVSGGKKTYSFTLKKESSSKGKTYAELAYENEATGNYPQALKYYEKALNKNNKDLTAMLGKARCLQGTGSVDDAADYYKRAARRAAAIKNKDAGVKALSGLIELRPNNFTNYDLRGDLLYSQGQYSQAAEDFQKVIALDRHNLKAYYKLGDSRYKSGRYRDALDAYQAAEELHFADPKAQACLAETYRALDDKKKTQKAYEKFKELASYGTVMEYQNDPEWKKVLDYLGIEY